MSARYMRGKCNFCSKLLTSVARHLIGQVAADELFAAGGQTLRLLDGSIVQNYIEQ
jgi:hypothetical protein